ncbi:family 18 glycosyl hydrolase [Diaporthe sp. PMI_573]|nr:family 18 glycosyl hydrolase [Diaporthaceae sp. PMI_573]
MVLSTSLAALILGASAPFVSAAKPCNKRATNSSSGLVAATYFAGYHANRGFPVSSIPWDKYTEIKYAFAETSADGSLNLTKSAPDQLPVFVSDAKKNGVKALVSIGGWTGSRFFSSSVGSAENRTAFIKNSLDLVSQYQLDGLDFDWEYPNKQGLGCNAINVNDTANFLTFLQELRQQAPNLTLTAATSLFPWNDATGSRSTDLSGFAEALDYMMIMNYDIYGAWASTAGPNAPLDSACDARNIMGSGNMGVQAWLDAGVPADKLVLGLAAYGHGFRVNETSAMSPNGTLQLYPAQNSSDRFQGSSWDDDPPIDDCGNAQPPSGTYPLWSLITEAGFLDETAKPLPGIQYTWDNCSQTPFLWNATSNVYVSYDDAESITVKGEYIMNTGLKGWAVWEAGGDYNNIIVDAARKSTGLA